MVVLNGWYFFLIRQFLRPLTEPRLHIFVGFLVVREPQVRGVNLCRGKGFARTALARLRGTLESRPEALSSSSAARMSRSPDLLGDVLQWVRESFIRCPITHGILPCRCSTISAHPWLRSD